MTRAGYDIGRAAPAEVPAAAALDVTATDREFAQAALESGMRAACDSSLAVTLGNWSYTAKDSRVAETGQYLTAWRLSNAGQWRIVLDQSINLPSMPAAALPTSASCDERSSSLEKLLAAECKLNSGLHNLHVTDFSSIAVKAVTP